MLSGSNTAQVSSTSGRNRQCQGSVVTRHPLSVSASLLVSRYTVLNQQRGPGGFMKQGVGTLISFLWCLADSDCNLRKHCTEWNEHSRPNFDTGEVNSFHFSESPFLLLYIENIMISTCKVASRIKKEHTLECSLWHPKHHTNRKQKLTSCHCGAMSKLSPDTNYLSG